MGIRSKPSSKMGSKRNTLGKTKIIIIWAFVTNRLQTTGLRCSLILVIGALLMLWDAELVRLQKMDTIFCTSKGDNVFRL